MFQLQPYNNKIDYSIIGVNNIKILSLFYYYYIYIIVHCGVGRCDLFVERIVVKPTCATWVSFYINNTACGI